MLLRPFVTAFASLAVIVSWVVLCFAVLLMATLAIESNYSVVTAPACQILVTGKLSHVPYQASRVPSEGQWVDWYLT